MRTSSNSIAAVMAIMFGLSCGLAQAQAYRWVDKDGKVRYSDVPPAGVKATPLKPPPAPPAPPPTAAKDAAAKDSKDAKNGKKDDAKKGPLTPAEQEQAYRERQAKAKEDKDKADKEAVLAEQRKQNCASAQEALRTMETGRRVGTTNAQGETVFLDEAQMQERMTQARRAVAEFCSR